MTNTPEIKEKFWVEMPVRRGWEAVRHIFPLLEGRGYISGSYAGFMAAETNPLEPGDIDIFAVSVEAWEDLGKEMSGKLDYLMGNPFHQDSPVINLIPFRSLTGSKSVQLIRPHPSWITFPDDILEWFDLDVSRAVLVAPDKVLADVNLGKFDAKLLRISDPLRSLKRVLKYHKRGVEFNDWELLKLFQAWDLIDADRKASMITAAHELAFPEMEPEEDYPDDVSYDVDDGYRFD